MAKSPVQPPKPQQTLTLGGVEVTSGEEAPTRMAILLWGKASAGKTTFAATMPGKKLWLSLGDNEHISVQHRDDVLVANYSGLSLDEFWKHANSDNPFGLDHFLAEHTEIESVVFDSVTALEDRALRKAIAEGIGAGRGFTPTIEAPGLSAYGARNAFVLAVLTGILRITQRHGVHVLVTAHENTPVMKKDIQGNEVIDYISIMLTDRIINNTSWRLSEIWHLRADSTGKRWLSVRPYSQREPMKSRMFDPRGPANFELTYDAALLDDAPKQETIAKWFNNWRAAKWRKIMPPGKAPTKGNE